MQSNEREIDYTPPAKMPEGCRKNGLFLFAAYGCALTERRTPSGMYVYTVVNLATGEAEVLSRRKRKLKEENFADMAGKIAASAIRTPAQLAVDKMPGERPEAPVLAQTVRDVFTDVLPQHGYALREKQLELAGHILDVTKRREITLAESEVGTGKTLAYLVPAVLVKRGRLNDASLRGRDPRQRWAESAHMPVVVSTSSIALQKALVEDYIPELSRILLLHEIIRKPLTAVVRKGKEHYICEKRLQRYYNNAGVRERGRLAPYVGPDAPFDLTVANDLTPHMKRGICVSGGECAEKCAYARKCRYLAHQRKVSDPRVDFQITNHNFFLADVLHCAEGKRPLLPNYQLVVIDEAHKFLEAARSMYGLELSATELPELANEIHAFTTDKSNGGVNVHKLAKKLEEQNTKLFRSLNANISHEDGDEGETDRFPAIFDGEAARHFRNMIGIAEDIAVVCDDSPVQRSYKERKQKALWRLNEAAKRMAALRKRDNLICWLEKRVEGDALCAIPKDLDVQLHRDLWSSGIPIVLTFGTLSAGQNFARITQTLGLNHLREGVLSEVSMPSPFDHRKNSLLYISENVPFPNYKDKRYIPAIAEEIERLVTASHGHAAVLFTSYNAMGQVCALLESRKLPFPLFRLERGGTAAIQRFKRSGNGILLASGALWEGIDIPGDALSLLIIVKLPFPVPDPIGDYERDLCGDIEVYKQRVIIPDMQIRLKQGDGRLIRSLTDTGAVALLDSRAREGATYHKVVLEALPERRTTSSLSDLHDFFRQVKPPEHFLRACIRPPKIYGGEYGDGR